jgi:Leucine-rich repeat (LRR) protein
MAEKKNALVIQFPCNNANFKTILSSFRGNELTLLNVETLDPDSIDMCSKINTLISLKIVGQIIQENDHSITYKNNISGLKRLTSLTTLIMETCFVDENHINSNINSLVLERCKVSKYFIDNIKVISSLENLTLTEFECDEKFGFDFGRSFPNLTSLNLNYTDVNNEEIVTIGFLINLVELNLTYVDYLEQNNVDIFEPWGIEKVASFLNNLINLKKLNLSSTGIVTLSSLANLTQLTHLDLSNTNIEDITPLATLTNLKHLDISMCNEINPIYTFILAKLKCLTTLKTDCTILGPHLVGILLELTKLEILSLSSKELTCQQVAKISTMTKLTSLELVGNNHTDLSPLSNLFNLISLTLSGYQGIDVEDLQWLFDLNKLTILKMHLKYTAQDVLSFVATLPYLTDLYLDCGDSFSLTRLKKFADEYPNIKLYYSLDVSSKIKEKENFTALLRGECKNYSSECEDSEDDFMLEEKENYWSDLIRPIFKGDRLLYEVLNERRNMFKVASLYTELCSSDAFWAISDYLHNEPFLCRKILLTAYKNNTLYVLHIDMTDVKEEDKFKLEPFILEGTKCALPSFCIIQDNNLITIWTHIYLRGCGFGTYFVNKFDIKQVSNVTLESVDFWNKKDVSITSSL